MLETHVLIFLFLISILSATAIPSQSELVLFALLAAGAHDPAILILVATLGSAVGCSLNWLLGRYIKKFENKKWFPIRKKYLIKAENTFKKHGVYTLLLSWVPIIGDPITIAAGTAKVNFFVFLPVASVCKMLRYLFVYVLYKGIF